MTRSSMVAAVLVGVALAGGDIATAAPLEALRGDFPSLAAPRAVRVARTTAIPRCTSFVDAAFRGSGNGTVRRPFRTIGAAVTATRSGAVICVAQGTYAEQILPRTKYFTLAGGFQSGRAFRVRDSALYVSKARGRGGSFIRIEDPGPTGTQLTAIDGFDISGYSQAIYRDVYYSQRFDITNNYIHDNRCTRPSLAGAGFSLNNVSGTIRGNVIARNSCARGGAGSLTDTTNRNNVAISNNLVKGNSGTEPGISHGGGLYLFTRRITLTANEFVENSVTGWGAGLYLGAYTGGGQFTAATLLWNVYRGNRAGIAGGGMFCDDSATCVSDHEVYDRNCGGNIYFDSGSGGAGATIGKFDHLTNVGALAAGCRAPGAGVQIDRDNTTRDTYSFTNSLFWGNARNSDFVASCITGCRTVRVTVTYSMVQRRYINNGGVTITFGAGIVPPVDPRFVSAATGDFHLKSRFGHWTSRGYVADTVSSPALAKGDPRGAVNQQPPRAGNRTELGAFGNSNEASYVR